MATVLSCSFLAGLFYSRFVPIGIFWAIYAVTYGYKISNYFLRQAFITFAIALSHLIAAIIAISLPVAIANYLVAGEHKNILFPFLMIFVEKKDISFFLNHKFKDYFFSFLVNKLFCSKKIILFLKGALIIIQCVTFLSIILGAIEVFNDYHSHANPDIFDFFFPQYGAGMFWGGTTIFVFTFFFLNFIFPNKSLLKWKYRLIAISDFAPILRRLAVSPLFFHPYFFLSPAGRLLVKRNGLSAEKLHLLLTKAFRENKREIPEEWLK